VRLKLWQKIADVEVDIRVACRVISVVPMIFVTLKLEWKELAALLVEIFVPLRSMSRYLMHNGAARRLEGNETRAQAG
jgi:hypothetical protein